MQLSVDGRWHYIQPRCHHLYLCSYFGIKLIKTSPFLSFINSIISLNRVHKRACWANFLFHSRQFRGQLLCEVHLKRLRRLLSDRWDLHKRLSRGAFFGNLYLLCANKLLKRYRSIWIWLVAFVYRHSLLQVSRCIFLITDIATKVGCIPHSLSALSQLLFTLKLFIRHAKSSPRSHIPEVFLHPRRLDVRHRIWVTDHNIEFVWRSRCKCVVRRNFSSELHYLSSLCSF